MKSKEKCKEEDTELNVDVERGVASGHKQTFPMMSEQKPGQVSQACTACATRCTPCAVRPALQYALQYVCA